MLEILQNQDMATAQHGEVEEQDMVVSNEVQELPNNQDIAIDLHQEVEKPDMAIAPNLDTNP